MSEATVLPDSSTGQAVRARLVESVRRITKVHQVDDRGVLATSGKTVLLRESGDGRWRKLGRFPMHWPRDLGLWPRPAARLLRADMCNVWRTASGGVFGIRGGDVCRFDDGRVTVITRIQGDCCLFRSMIEVSTGAVYFGEYFMNPERSPVRIWRLDPDGRGCRVAWQFPQGAIRHVHGLHPDPYVAGRIWVTVGDNNGECHLYYTDDQFATLERVGDGQQCWRAVGLVFTPEHVVWISDSPMEPNHVYRLHRRTQQLERGHPVDATGWYMGRTRDGVYYCGTTVEKGPGVRTKQASVLVSADAWHWNTALGFPKDWWPMPWFKWGSLGFPSGDFAANNFWVFGEGLAGIDGMARRYSLSA